MTTTLEMVNDCMRRIGRPRVASLDPNGSSSHGEMERVINDTSRRFQTMGWWFNTIPKVAVSPNGSGNIVISTVAAVPILHMDAIDDEPWNNFTMRSGNLYDITKATDVFTAAVNLRLVLLLPNSDLPESFAQYIVTHSSLNYNRHFSEFASSTGSQTRDQQLQAEIMVAQMVVNKEEINASDINMIDTYSTRMIHGRPSMSLLLGYLNGY